MVVRCPGCQTAYRLDARRVPVAALRVRCPRCAHVFRLRSAPASEPSAAAPRPEARPWNEVLPGLQRDLRQPTQLGPRPEGGQTTAPPRRPTWNATPERTLQLGAPPRSAPAETPRLETAPFRPGDVAAAPVAPAVASNSATTASTTPAAPAVPTEAAVADRTHERARRLARVLVSDILVYNRETRDRALRDANLITALGAEINRAWELYKSKVSPEVVGNTTYFKDALNEILAEGQKVF